MSSLQQPSSISKLLGSAITRNQTCGNVYVSSTSARIGSSTYFTIFCDFKNGEIAFYLCSSSSRPVAKLSISTSSAPPPSSSSGPKICPVNFSFSAFFPPSGLNTLRLRAGLASGPKFFRAGRSRSAAPGSEKSGAGPRIGGGEGREPGAEGLGPNEGRYPPPAGRGPASLARASLTASGRPLNG